MKFDCVIQNPPYNNDMYIPFIERGFELIKPDGCEIAITPAKWQAKGGKDNDRFRANIVPHMKDIVYYPESSDVFDINECAGITYYIVDNNITLNKHIKNISKKQKLYNNDSTRDINCGLNNVGAELYTKVFKLTGTKSFNIEKLCHNGRFQVWLNNKVSVHSAWDKALYSPVGNFHCISLCRVIDSTANNDKPDDSRLIFASNSISDCESIKSWIYTKFVRYFVSNSLCGLTGLATSNAWWRFVPDPGAFDHIFTDEELYKKYNLTPEEINVIESVIKERK